MGAVEAAAVASPWTGAVLRATMTADVDTAPPGGETWGSSGDGAAVCASRISRGDCAVVAADRGAFGVRRRRRRGRQLHAADRQQSGRANARGNKPQPDRSRRQPDRAAGDQRGQRATKAGDNRGRRPGRQHPDNRANAGGADRRHDYVDARRHDRSGRHGAADHPGGDRQSADGRLPVVKRQRLYDADRQPDHSGAFRPGGRGHAGGTAVRRPVQPVGVFRFQYGRRGGGRRRR